MTLYLLTDFELNGYDDSDFVCSFYDSEANTIGFHTYGSTRYPSASNIGIFADGSTSLSINGGSTPIRMPTKEIVEKARQVLEETIFVKLVAGDKRYVETPDVSDLKAGLRVRLTSSAKMQVRDVSQCVKCNGSGKWVNPRNEDDKRECFACKGTGSHSGSKVKDADGKVACRKLEVGLSGEIIDWGSFGKFYSSGYNKPNRDNTSVQFKLDNGEIVRAGLSKLRLDRELTNPSELRERAKELSYNYQFSASYPRFAWDTHNFAVQVM